MPDVEEPADAGIMARKLVDAVELPFLIDTNDVRTGVTIALLYMKPRRMPRLYSPVRMWRSTVRKQKGVTPFGFSITPWT